MNPLQRVFIEKAGQEQGRECSFGGGESVVLLGSARHMARVQTEQICSTTFILNYDALRCNWSVILDSR